MSTRYKITFGLIKSSSHANNCRLRNLNRNKNDQGGACLVADLLYSRALAQLFARHPAQLRMSRRVRESDERKHMQKNQINSNQQLNKIL